MAPPEDSEPVAEPESARPAPETVEGSRPKKVLILAGEASGDSHGAELVEALKRIEPDVEIEAWGGHKLEEAGAKVHEDLVAHAVMGLFPVLAKLPYFIGVKRRILARISEWQPDV
ncbi:MAG: hypothetical protein ACYTFT_16720, partial [Planctomycetota bacterium]